MVRFVLRLCLLKEGKNMVELKSVKSELLAKERDIVVPGDVLAKGLDYLPGSGVYRTGQELRSKYLGLVKTKDRLVIVVPLSGVYIPKPGDGVVAFIEDMQPTFWITNINSPYDAILQVGEAVSEYVEQGADISVYYDLGEVIYAKVLDVTRGKQVRLTMNDYKAKKLVGGRLLTITPSKVPRVIGKEGSMIEVIRSKTGTMLTVGQNGIVWLKGGYEGLAAKAVLMIEREAHTEGLTDRVTEFLETELEAAGLKPPAGEVKIIKRVGGGGE